MRILSVGWETSTSMTGGLGVHYSELTSCLSKKASVRHVLPKSSDPSFRAYNSYLASLPSSSCDILHSHDWFTAPGSARLARRSNIPFVLSVHSTVFDREFIPSPFFYQIERSAFHSADHIITVSSMLKNTLISKYAIPENMISVIPNGLPFPISRRKFSPPSHPVILFSGRLVSQKSPETLIYAVPRVLSVFPGASFVFCGSGYLRDSLEDFAERLGVRANVRFTGFVPHSDMPSYYSMASLLVSTSFSEPFGLSILEAMGAGLPCIVTPDTGLLEFCTSPVISSRTSSAISKAVLSLLSSPSLMRKLSTTGKSEASSFSWDSVASQTLKVYEHALAVR